MHAEHPLSIFVPTLLVTWLVRFIMQFPIEDQPNRIRDPMPAKQPSSVFVKNTTAQPVVNVGEVIQTVFHTSDG